MQVTFDLFDSPQPSPAPAPPARLGRSAVTQAHPFGAPRTRGRLREELMAANVATVRFDIDGGSVTKVSQFIPAGNQCIGLYPEPLKRVGLELLVELVPESGAWSGAIEWEVAADRPKGLNVPGTDDKQADQEERPRG